MSNRGKYTGKCTAKHAAKYSRGTRWAAALAVSVVVFAACSSDDDGGAPGATDSGQDAGVRDDDAEDYLSGDAATTVPSGTEAPAETDLPANTVPPGQARDQVSADAEDQLAGNSAPPDAEDGLFDDGLFDDGDGGLFDEPEPDPDESFEESRFEDYGYRDFIQTARDPLSTFALDVDTGAYTIGRRALEAGELPPRASVRPEEYINAFDYDYRAPRDGLDVSVDGGPSPFDRGNHLVRIGVQAEIVEDSERRPAALTFVIDTSGSMDRPDRLGLVKESLAVLVNALDDDDTVAIVTYSDSSGVVLYPTSVADKFEILQAIGRLGPGGSTNLESGLREGYSLAREAFREDGINRVVLASDGVANAGQTDPVGLARMIRDDADRGIDLVTVGYGMGDFNDATMEQLADLGDGFYAYVDTIGEAERLFEDELTSTLMTVAKDAKIQVEFDPDVVEAYRLIGFENRAVRDSDFRNDAVDAGELGAGHQVTAMYEITLNRDVSLGDRRELGVVHLLWQDPDSGEEIEIDEDIDMRDIEADWRNTPDDFQLATVVTTFAELLRDNPYADDVDIRDLVDEVERLADELGDDQVDELADLIAAASRLL